MSPEDPTQTAKREPTAEPLEGLQDPVVQPASGSPDGSGAVVGHVDKSVGSGFSGALTPS